MAVSAGYNQADLLTHKSEVADFVAASEILEKKVDQYCRKIGKCAPNSRLCGDLIY